MNANQFRIISVSVAVQAEHADTAAEQLNDFASSVGFYSLGTSDKVPNRKEWAEIKDNVPQDILDADEQQRRDEKHGLFGDKTDVAN
jgi:hypothetical protein